jgi:molybdenum cofactor cytidylyltransferase
LETIKTVQRSQANSLFVVLGSNAEFITAQCNLIKKGINIIINPNWSNGLGDSIAYGVKVLLEQQHNLNGILICLADQPLLTTNYLDTLIYQSKKHPLNIVATNYEKKVGVPALFPKLLFKDLSELKGDFGAKELLNNGIKAIITLEAENQTIDIDTKDEYNQLLSKINNTYNH